MFYRVFINGIERDAIKATSYAQAKQAAKALYRVSCDIIGAY